MNLKIYPYQYNGLYIKKFYYKNNNLLERLDPIEDAVKEIHITYEKIVRCIKCYDEFGNYVEDVRKWIRNKRRK